jgi:hypothetical protein
MMKQVDTKRLFDDARRVKLSRTSCLCLSLKVETCGSVSINSMTCVLSFDANRESRIAQNESFLFEAKFDVDFKR